MTIYERFFTTIAARVDAETAHKVAFGAMRAAARVPGLARYARRHLGPGDSHEIQVWGQRFPGPLGIAAGFDKNAVGIDALAALGFAFVEVGTVTARPQPGNPRPRLHRLLADSAIVNRMGFNNDGAAVVAARLARRRRSRTALPVIVGVNIGKSKVVADVDAAADYAASTRLLAPYADYLVVNVSSPNTPGLRDLQAVDRLHPLLETVRKEADSVTDHHVPLLVKIAPDLRDEDIVAVADLAAEVQLDGIIATNTTISREGLTSDSSMIEAAGAGGLSGPVLRERSCDVLRLIRQRLSQDDMPVISVGGITTAQDARERLDAGATLLQAYTGFIYGGPLWPHRITSSLGGSTNGLST